MTITKLIGKRGQRNALRIDLLYVSRRNFSLFPLLKNILKPQVLLVGSGLTAALTLNEYLDELKGRMNSALKVFNLIDLENSFLKKKEKKQESFEFLLPKIPSSVDIPTKLEAPTKLEKSVDFKKFETKINSDKESANKSQADSGVSKTTPSNSFMNNFNDNNNAQARLDTCLNEFIEVQKSFQRELDRLDNDNKILAKENHMLMKKLASFDSEISGMNRKFSNKSLIDQYATVLDKLNDFHSSVNYRIKDSLPRIVVIGDQSSGKTSVLEAIAGARIFPRGHGQMMTKSPIMLTLGEGPINEAYFNDSPNRKYDLTEPENIDKLRNEIFERMNSHIESNKTISATPVSLTLKGPNIPRMILVDLPGIINTVTKDMSIDAKDSIMNLAKNYMSNPNSIILCIQDGSVDAERSLVTDLVRNMDPEGRRTICIMTKLDVAEKNDVDGGRVKKLLSGELFPMKALGYYAVIAGTGNSNETIDDISKYELDFFKNSKLFKSGSIAPSQAGTQKMVLSVSGCFWNLVKTSVEKEAENLRNLLFALETEWKHCFPDLRELSRQQLFEKACSEVMDDTIKLTTTMKNLDWENRYMEKLQKPIMFSVFNDIYLPNALNGTPLGFQTQVEIQLNNWMNKGLTELCVDLAIETFCDSINEIFDSRKNQQYYETFEPLRSYILEEFKENFEWGQNNFNSLKIIQQAVLSDTNIEDRVNWCHGTRFAELALTQETNRLQRELKHYIGPSFLEKWVSWKFLTPDQKLNAETYSMLKNIHASRKQKRYDLLSNEEVSDLITKLKKRKVYINDGTVVKLWSNLIMTEFLKNSTKGMDYCRRNFNLRNYSDHPLECNEVVLFWRVYRLLNRTGEVIRQQILGSECKRFELFLKNLLSDENKVNEMRDLIEGKHIDLAEKINHVSSIKETLDVFMNNLQNEHLFQ